MKVDVKDDHKLVYNVTLKMPRSPKDKKKPKDMLVMDIGCNWGKLKFVQEKPECDVDHLDTLHLVFSLTDKDGNKAIITVTNETPAERRLIEGIRPDYISSSARTHKLIFIHPLARARLETVSSWTLPQD